MLLPLTIIIIAVCSFFVRVIFLFRHVGIRNSKVKLTIHSPTRGAPLERRMVGGQTDE